MKKINHIDSIRNPIITEKATILSEQNESGNATVLHNHCWSSPTGGICDLGDTRRYHTKLWLS